MVLEVDGGDLHTCTVVKRVGSVLDELLAKGRVPRPEKREPFPADAVVKPWEFISVCEGTRRGDNQRSIVNLFVGLEPSFLRFYGSMVKLASCIVFLFPVL